MYMEDEVEGFECLKKGKSFFFIPSVDMDDFRYDIGFQLAHDNIGMHKSDNNNNILHLYSGI